MDNTLPLRILLLGEEKVGKTAIVRCFRGERFSETYRGTIGAEWSIRSVETKGQSIKLQVVSSFSIFPSSFYPFSVMH
jgi:GTPase SAR1 family protein